MSQENKIAIVVDDDENVSAKWKSQLASLLAGRLSVTVETFSLDSLNEEVQILEDRRANARSGSATSGKINASRIDKCSVLIVDFDLLDAWHRQERSRSEITGETVAYLARCFSGCGYIVAVNRRHRSRVFDLTLKGIPESFADMDIPEESIASSALWFPSRDAPHFRPWYWPSIPTAIDAYEDCVRAIEEAPNDPVMLKMGLQKGDIEVLRMEVLEFILGVGGQTRGLDDALSLAPAEVARRAIRSVQPKDVLMNEYSSRIAAARLRKWLHWRVLPGQDPISDLPHVVSRIQGLAAEYAADVLNITTDPDPTTALGAFSGATMDLQPFLLPEACRKWWPNPVVNWRKLLDDPRTVDIQMKQDSYEDLVFCEDISAFLPRSAA